jgi:alpha-tubulin suppressor-like RCC1 family protein
VRLYLESLLWITNVSLTCSFGTPQLGTGLGMAVDMYAMTSHPNEITADELAGRRVAKIAAGASHAAAITDGGELFYWGMSLYFEPVRVTALLHTKVRINVSKDDNSIAL